MSYRVDLGVVTDEKGIKTILESNAWKTITRKHELVISVINSCEWLGEPKYDVYHFMLEDMSYTWLEKIGLFKTIKSLEYYETLLVGEDINDIEHNCVWPESMNDDPPLYYLSLERKIVASKDFSFWKHSNPEVMAQFEENNAKLAKALCEFSSAVMENVLRKRKR